MLDDAAPALGAQLRVVERRLIGGAADSEIERLGLRDVASRLGSERAVRAENILRGHAAVVECQCAASAVARADGRLGLDHGEAGRIARHQQRGDTTFADARLHDEQRR